MQGKRCFEWITDDIVEIKSRQPLALSEAIRMNDDERAQFLSLFPERREGRVGQFLSGDIGEDLDALELERLHTVLKLLCSLFAVLHRHSPAWDKTIAVPRHKFGDALVDHARGWYGIFERDRVIALRRRRHHQLYVDSHVVHDRKTLVIARHAAANVGLLLGIDRLGFGRCEVSTGDRAEIEMRLDEFSGARHGNVRVGIDGDAFRPDITPRLAMLARSGVRIFVPDLRHFASFLSYAVAP